MDQRGYRYSDMEQDSNFDALKVLVEDKRSDDHMTKLL